MHKPDIPRTEGMESRKELTQNISLLPSYIQIFMERVWLPQDCQPTRLKKLARGSKTEIKRRSNLLGRVNLLGSQEHSQSTKVPSDLPYADLQLAMPSQSAHESRKFLHLAVSFQIFLLAKHEAARAEKETFTQDTTATSQCRTRKGGFGTERQYINNLQNM